MANATAIVAKGGSDRRYFRRSTETLGAETTFYKHAFIGLDSTGYYCKGDDTQSWVFAGVVRGEGGNPKLPAATAGDDSLLLDIWCPEYLEVAITSVAVTDIGKKVYASDDQTGVLANTALTYANFIGHVVDVVASNIALVKLSYTGIGGHGAYGVSKWMAATGAQSLTKHDLNKTIMLPNTAALALTLPAIATTQAGDRFTFVKTTSDAAAITLTGNSSDNIDGSNTLATIDAQYDCATLVSTGSAWIVVARDIA